MLRARMRLVLFLIFFCCPVFAAPVTVNVTDNKGNPVFRAVVYFEAEILIDTPVPQKMPVMDQVDRQFVPHILVVQEGQQVNFPNSDSIKHHVYSFSTAKQFELKLYSGSKAQPINFPDAGEVELGCNVHDWMLGYILVVNTPYFAKTDMQGNISIDLPPGSYKAKLWHPRIQDDPNSLVKPIAVDSGTSLNFNLKQELLVDLSGFEQQTDSFGEYN